MVTTSNHVTRVPREGASPVPISVVMAVRDEAGNVGAALDSLAQQTYPVEALELIVVDGRSEDATVDEVVAWSRAHPDVRLRVLDNPRRLQAAAFNIGLCEASAEMIFIMSSAHGEIDHDYIEKLYAAMSDDESIWVAGGHSRATGRTRWGDAVARAISSPFALGAPAWRMGTSDADVDHVGYGLYRRHAFDAAGNFSEDLVINEDYELTYRIRRAGGRVRLVADAQARYLTRDTPRGLIRQYWTYGVYKALMLVRNPASAKLRHLAPAAFVATIVLLACASLRRGGQVTRRLTAALVSVYGAAVGVAARRACSDDMSMVAPTSAAIALMQLLYGAGNLFGLVRALSQMRAHSTENVPAPGAPADGERVVYAHEPPR